MNLFIRKNDLRVNKRLLVTGGAGYIGSHTCKLLFENGYTPVVFDNLSEGHRWAVKWGDLFIGDLQNIEDIKKCFSKYQFLGVIHFGGSACIGESMIIPQKYFRNNVIGTLNLLDVMLDNGVNNIVFSSTCATYGIPETLPITENFVQKPVNPYGESKLMIEKILMWYEQINRINYSILRYFNAAGADETGEIGEAHFHETHIIPLCFEAINGKRVLQVFGTDYKTNDGTCIRDYIHVNDLALAHLKSIEYLIKMNKSFSMNLGTGNGTSVLEVIKSVEKVSGKKCNVNYAEERKGDPAELISYFDSNNIIEWEPKYKNIDDIVATAWNWSKKFNE